MSTKNRRDRDSKGRINLHRNGYYCFLAKTPSWWTREFMNRPKRNANKRLCKKVEQGMDPEGIAWPLGSKKPHVYFW